MEAPEHLHLHGDYEVGVRMLELSYQPPGQEEERTLPVIVWHPTDNVEGLRREPVKMAKTISLSKKRYRNAELAQGAPRPVLVHSNGAGGEASLAYRTAEVFASRGWVVASISHVGNTTFDALGDPLDVPMYIPVYRMLDVQTVLDAAEEGFGLEGFAEQVDVNNTVVYGHSFGGYTSLALGGATFLRDGAQQMVCEEDVECEEGDILCGQHNEEACAFLDDEEIVEVTEQGFRDERVKAIGLQAPGALGIIDPSTVETPALLMSADQDGWLPHAREAAPIWDALHQPEDLWLRFADAGHLSFITMCDEEAFTPSIIEQFLPGVANDGCNPDYMSSMDMSDINTAYLVMFAEKHVFGTSHWDEYLYGDKPLSISEGVNMTVENRK